MDQADRDLLTALLPLAVRLGDGAFKSADPQDLAAVVAERPGAGRAAPRTGGPGSAEALLLPAEGDARPSSAGTSSSKRTIGSGRAKLSACTSKCETLPLPRTATDFRTQVQMAIEVHNEQRRDGVAVRPAGPIGLEPVAAAGLLPRRPIRRCRHNLPAGAYTLWLKVTDVPTGRTTRRSLDFRVTTVKDVRSGGAGE